MEILREIIQQHYQETLSKKAGEILENFQDYIPKSKKIIPKDYYRMMSEIQKAEEQGDLSENAEYDAAKDEQRDIEAQIVELENILKNAEIIQDNDKSKDKIKMERLKS